jgi:hypothetical protein
MIVNRPWTCRQDRRNFAVALALDYPVEDLSLPSRDANLSQFLRRGDCLGGRSFESGELLSVPVGQGDLRSHQLKERGLISMVTRWSAFPIGIYFWSRGLKIMTELRRC